MRTQRQELTITHKNNKILVYTKDEMNLLEGRKLVKNWIINSLIIGALIVSILLVGLNIVL